MKKLISFLALSFCALTVNAQATHNMKITFQDGNTVVYGMENVKSVEFVEKEEPSSKETYTINGVEYPMPEAIDLGLPSGTKWASMNIGAKDINDAGLYFAWCEAEPKDIFTIDNYKHTILDSSGNFSYFSYFDTKTITLDNDAAYNNLGDEWRVPTVDQFNELMLYLAWSAEKGNDDLPLRIVGTAANGNVIYFYIDDKHDWLSVFNYWFSCNSSSDNNHFSTSFTANLFLNDIGLLFPLLYIHSTNPWGKGRIRAVK